MNLSVKSVYSDSIFSDSFYHPFFLKHALTHIQFCYLEQTTRIVNCFKEEKLTENIVYAFLLALFLAYLSWNSIEALKQFQNDVT
jgi:hypothetical protein